MLKKKNLKRQLKKEVSHVYYLCFGTPVKPFRPLTLTFADLQSKAMKIIVKT